MSELIGLDFETYGATDLPTHGLDRYVDCPTFKPLIGSVSYRLNNRDRETTFDFINDRRGSVRELREATLGTLICAHNAPFEQRVMDWMGLRTPAERFIDSAVVARAAGAGSSLEAAAPQLLGVDKLESGKNLIRLFSIPGKYQEASGNRRFDPQVIEDNPIEWADFIHYCEIDARLSRRIVEDYQHYLAPREMEYQAITMDMNQVGWRVDGEIVEEMQRRYQENMELALWRFRQDHDAEGLNLNSLKQLKEWCAERGVKASSFDEKHVEKLIGALEKKLASITVANEKYRGYNEVLTLLRTKQTLGGSSLKKLAVILNTTGNDGRLRDQYIHCGAGQTLRTTGRSVQMQNLKRLAEPGNMEELLDPGVDWDNDELAQNLRQCFTATEETGRLIVGDFSSVESRGLAYLAGEEWKLVSYRQGKDLYKVLASSMFGVHYDDVTKAQRQTGKVGELSCGYGAGPGAVASFAAGMGVEMSEGETSKLVSDWRATNPMVVNLWNRLDSMLHAVVEEGMPYDAMQLPDGLRLELSRCNTPATLVAQHPGAQSVRLTVYTGSGQVFMHRYFHGCYARGRGINYYKPSDRKTGDLWRSHFVDPKTKQVKFYSIYGGKLAGILTQSFCREIFFQVLAEVNRWVYLGQDQLKLVGQFHDEIVVEWRDGPMGLHEAKRQLERIMSDPGALKSFPLGAEIKHDYRYTK